MIVITTQCFPPDRGGIEALMGGLGNALHEAGHGVTVFADRVRTANAAAFAPPYAVHRFGGLRPIRRWWKAQRVSAFVRDNDVTGIFADSWKSVERLPALRAPIAVLVHGTEIPVSPSPSKRARIAATLGRAHAVVVNSQYTASVVRPYLADGDKRLHLVRPPIGPQAEPSDAARAAFGATIAGRAPVILTVARLEPRKGIDMIIAAMPAVLRVYPNALYVVAGDGADRERLQGLAAREGVAERVRFVGAVDGDNKAAIYAAADVFAMPSRRIGNSVESFGIAYLEAAWYGAPALAGNDGGAADAVSDGETGLLCDGADGPSVTETLLKLLDEKRRTTLGAAARARAHGPAQWAQSLPLYLNALR